MNLEHLEDIPTMSRTALGPTQPPIQQASGALSLGVKRPGRETDHSPPSSTEVRNAWRYTSTPQYVFMAWCLVKHRDNFTFTFTEWFFSAFWRWDMNTDFGCFLCVYFQSKWLGYGLDDRGSRVLFPAEAGNLYLHHHVQNVSGAHSASYPMSKRGSFSESNAAGAWSWPLTSI
jgi:hypothetical protein